MPLHPLQSTHVLHRTPGFLSDFLEHDKSCRKPLPEHIGHVSSCTSGRIEGWIFGVGGFWDWIWAPFNAYNTAGNKSGWIEVYDNAYFGVIGWFWGIG